MDVLQWEALPGLFDSSATEVQGFLTVFVFVAPQNTCKAVPHSNLLL